MDMVRHENQSCLRSRDEGGNEDCDLSGDAFDGVDGAIC
jgi:hypothetical protein